MFRRANANSTFFVGLINCDLCVLAPQFRNQTAYSFRNTRLVIITAIETKSSKTKILLLNILAFGIHCPKIYVSYHRLLLPSKTSSAEYWLYQPLFAYTKVSLRNLGVWRSFRILAVTIVKAPKPGSKPATLNNISFRDNRRMLDSVACIIAITPFISVFSSLDAFLMDFSVVYLLW